MQLIAPLLLDNARRLLDDAQLLRKARRYASATALAVLSIEEAGKFILANNLFSMSGSLKKPDLRSHKGKQRAAARAIMGSMGVDEIRDLLEAAGYKMKIVRIDDNQHTERHELEDIVAKIPDHIYDKRIAPKIRNSAQNKFVLWVAQGKFDEIKQRAFYVDVGPNGDPVSPSAITRDTADRILRLASRTLSNIRVMVRYEAAYRRTTAQGANPVPRSAL